MNMGVYELVLIFRPPFIREFHQVDSLNFVNFCILLLICARFVVVGFVHYIWNFVTRHTISRTAEWQLASTWGSDVLLDNMNDRFFSCSDVTVVVVCECAFALCDIPKNQIWTITSKEKDTAHQCRYCHNKNDSHLLTRPLPCYGYGKEMHLFLYKFSFLFVCFYLIFSFIFNFALSVNGWFATAAAVREAAVWQWLCMCVCVTNVSSLSTVGNNRLAKHPLFAQIWKKIGVHC